MNVSPDIDDFTRGGSRSIRIAGMVATCDPSGALHFASLGLLVVSDLHLEKGSAQARRGMLVPPYDTGATLDRLGRVIADLNPRAVVSLGDSFHDGQGAARLPELYRDRLLAMMEGREWLWVAGNHDPGVPAGLPGSVADEIAIGGLLFRHEPQVGAAAGEIAGHLHPGAVIVQRGRAVRRRCFATDGERLIMPAFGAYTGSLNVLDRAYGGLFRWQSFFALMLGADRVYAMAHHRLRGG
jgi:DNA ligase-associated metallophosphoesterase